MNQFLSSLGEQVEDAEEESFLLFIRDIPSANLGFVDSRAPSVQVTIHDHDYTIQQSPTLLSSSRAGGTTGAVLWKITPLFAEWISSLSSNPLWTHPSSLLPSSSSSATTTVVELGCGISGLVALALGPRVRHYIATDQEYVHRLLRENLEANRALAYRQKGIRTSQKKGGRSIAPGAGAGHTHTGQKKRGQKTEGHGHEPSNISFAALDWELDAPEMLKESVGMISTSSLDLDPNGNGGDNEDKGFDLLLSCDCIYNEALVAPFVRTCADICRLRPVYRPDDDDDDERRRGQKNPTICIIAQQQRSPDVFEAWLVETLKVFWVWRLSDEVLGDGLKAGTGYVVHLLLLK